MALEGNLTAFGLSEILQLIAVQQKTGMLTVTNVDNTTVMFFRGGEIVSTRDRRRKARDSFKDYLTRYGVLEREQLVRISQISAQSKLDFTDILTSEGFLTRETLLKHWRKQVLETLHDVLTWEEGTYKFVTSQEIVDGIKSLESFNVEGMLMESMRRIDEFPQMLEMFPSEKLVFERRDGQSEAEETTENERDVLAIVADPKSLRDVIACARMPVFEVYEALKQLREKGLVSTREPEDGGSAAPDGETRQRTRRDPFKNVLPLLTAGLFFVGSMYVGFHGALGHADFESLSRIEVPVDSRVERARLEQHLRWLLEAYHATNGAYPDALSSLESAGLASHEVIEKSRAHAFRYRLTANQTGYTLL
jgi:hypothetical protein